MVLNRSLRHLHSKEEEKRHLGWNELNKNEWSEIPSHHQLQLKAKIDCEQHCRGRHLNSEKRWQEQDTHWGDAGPKEQRRHQQTTPERRTPMFQRW